MTTTPRPRKKLFPLGGRLPYIDPARFGPNPDPNLPMRPPAYPIDKSFSIASRHELPPLTIDPYKKPGLTVPEKGMTTPFDWKSALQQGAGYAKDITPYASNIVNAFRKPPVPTRPTMDSAPVLQKVDMTADRNAVSRELNSATAGAERSLDGNTAEKIRQYNVGQKLNALSGINSQERNQNTQIQNQQAMMSAQTAAGNNAKLDAWHDDIKEGQIAQGREQSANFANAADKAVAIRNEKEKGRVEIEKANVMMSLYNNSGVLRRQGAQWKASGMKDPFGQDWKWLDESYPVPAPVSGSIKRYGGNLKLKR